MYHQHKALRHINREDGLGKQWKEWEDGGGGRDELPLISHFYAHCVCMPVQALHASPRGKSSSSGGKTCSSCFFFWACSKKGGVKERWVSLYITWNLVDPPFLSLRILLPGKQNPPGKVRTVQTKCLVMCKIIAGPPMPLSGNNPSPLFSGLLSENWDVWRDSLWYGGIYLQALLLC